jgi:PPM family protein phosphatase
VCVVADGMGGHTAGDVAAQLAVDTVVDALSRAPVSPSAITRAVAAADDAIRGRSAASRSPMGTTLVGVTLAAMAGATVPIVFHAGDSRCYRLHDGVLDLITRDHSFVQHLVDAGCLDPRDAGGHPRANVVTRALGIGDRYEAGPADLTVLPAVACRLLLCTDGLSDQVPARAIGRVLAGLTDPAEAARRLVELTLAGPARDNVTAVVVDVLLGPPTTLTAATRDNERRVDQHVRASSTRSIV